MDLFWGIGNLLNIGEWIGAAQILDFLMRAPDKYGVDATKIFMFGFSQGATMVRFTRWTQNAAHIVTWWSTVCNASVLS